MKHYIKNLSICLALGAVTASTTSCNDALDMEPISQITPENYYQSASQVESYLNNYYNTFLMGPYTYMYHQGGWNDGLISSDSNTDILVQGLNGNTTLFANDHWDTPSAKQLQGYYGNIRAVNFLINTVEQNIESGVLDGNDAAVKSALGEAYFMRALGYFRMLGMFGDLPIVKEVLLNTDEAIIPASERKPRTEVADFILEDLDKAIANLKDRSAYNGQRLNKQSAQVFASRVALFEATFEKYHKGSGRVPGDANWPGAKMSYNSGKSFNIDAHISTLLDKAMAYAKPVADAAVLTENTGLLSPPNKDTYWGWNPYFEMYGQNSLANNEEVLLWKEYSTSFSITHDVPFRSIQGCADGYTMNLINSFLCKDGLPIYASDQYQGDDTYTKVRTNRDERLQLFLWTDQLSGQTQSLGNVSDNFFCANIISSNQEIRCITGYQPRKYFTYDKTQISDDALHGVTACPIFRSAEALLNYMEASAEKNGGRPDNTAIEYWKRLRARAGVSTDIEATVAATDLDKEYNKGNGDFGVYSGTQQVDKWIYNVRRERVNETFSEGLRRQDLTRWRAYDNMLTTKWIPQGCNFWTSIYKDLEASYSSGETIKADGSSDANVSAQSLSIYLRPYSRNMSTTNELKDGLNWHEAYYLYPLGTVDLTSASEDRSIEKSMLYQNINWSTQAGDHALK